MTRSDWSTDLLFLHLNDVQTVDRELGLPPVDDVPGCPLALGPRPELGLVQGPVPGVQVGHQAVEGIGETDNEDQQENFEEKLFF